MKIGHSFPVNTSRHESLLSFKENVEAKSNGAIVVELYPSGQLGTEMEMLEAVKLNALEGLRCGPFEDAAPELLIYTMPFLFSDMDAVHRVTRGEITERIIKNTEKNGIKVLAVGDSGEFRQFTNNARPITKPEDIKGLKIRTPPMESIVKIMETLGGNPVSIPFSETYMALKTGVADGEENPYTNIDKMKFYEVQKYLSVVNYQYHAEMLYVPLDWFNKLSSELQEILVECARDHMILNDELLQKESLASYEVLKANMEVNVLNDAQRKVFIDKVQPVYKYYIDKGIISQADIDEIRKIASGN
ncbi:TRAP transporter substrate-binding protein [Oceanispirochaeta crateris]|uniref:TRAP transporter substrate-binding protein n=2 Tax=Oceanispirochaeta crateris TaxID=2518645 RepID=A0A5C1QV30_9SPIO|nr:TRAP transporter substrate-binding protein [Oceanispirochaeta crateris]